MGAVGRPRSCECGECDKCKRREYQRRWYSDKTPEERRKLVKRRDIETVRKNDRKRYYRNWDKRRAACDEYQKRHRKEVAENKKRWIEDNPEKRQAHLIANNAVRDGILIRQMCEFLDSGECKGRVEKHHEDYSKPLDVRWLCRKHHAETYRKYND